MTYNEAIDFLFTSLPMFQRVGGAAYKANLDNTHRLDGYFGHPHRKFRTIHVAGTNGKGSTSHMLAAVLQSAGYKTGLYTSPHLLDFRERIKVNGQMIPKQEVLYFVEHHQEIIQEIKPSFFEMSVAMAFDYFARQQVDIAIIEVGMGGRLDSTNIIAPLLSIITNISYDHGQFLGDTPEKIAVEKAGIIKSGIPVVIGESHPDTKPVFERTAREKQSPVYFADQLYNIRSVDRIVNKQKIELEDIDRQVIRCYELDLMGCYQQKNIKTVLTAIDCLLRVDGIEIGEEHIEAGLSCASHLTGLRGRWQVLSERPLVVADTGHNEAGVGEVVAQIRNTPHDRLFMVFGVMNDKDLDKIWPLLPRDAYYFFTQAKLERALDANRLAEQGLERGFKGEVVSDIGLAIEKAKGLAEEGDMVFIGGSTFTVSEALEECL